MAITDQDKQTVRMILRKTLPSAFPQPLDPLTVQDVACHISAQWQWRELVFKWEAPMLNHLLTVTTALPVDLNDESVRRLLTGAAVDHDRVSRQSVDHSPDGSRVGPGA